MVKNFILSGLILVTGLAAQEDEILPFDWVNQNGLLQVNGHLFWNQDWVSGPLLFDGTYTAYPVRFGPSLARGFQLHATGMTRFPLQLPDSNTVITYFDYRRGDHFLDQIEVGGDFGTSRRQVTLRGFKRNYAGDHGQYIFPGGGNSPIQQSYLMEYLSRQGERQVRVGAGRFISQSGIPDSTSNGRFNDDILAAGLQLFQPLERFDLEISFQQFLQRRRVLLSFQSDSSWHSLNRNHFAGKISGETGFFLGLESDRQSLIQQSQLQTLTWTTLYTGKRIRSFSLALGYTFLDPNSRHQPFYRLTYSKKTSRIQIQARSAYEHHPRHPRDRLSDGNDLFDSWLRNQVSFAYQGDRLNIGLKLGAGQNTATLAGRSPRYTGLRLSSRLEFLPHWFLEGSYQAQLDTSLYLMGWDGIINVGLRGSADLFSGSLHLKGRFWSQGYLGPHDNFAFDPFNQIPRSAPSNRSLNRNQWVANFELRAFISSVVISYRIYNLMNSLSSAVSGIPDSQRWIQTNPYYPPLGRMVYFEVNWLFRN
jgi:hypothetical protein